MKVKTEYCTKCGSLDLVTSMDGKLYVCEQCGEQFSEVRCVWVPVESWEEGF